MEENRIRACERLVGVGEVEILGVDDEAAMPPELHVRTRCLRRCGGRGGAVRSKGTSPVRLVDMPAFGRPVRVIWNKWCGPLPGGGLCGRHVLRGR